jgi:2,3-bisphosphoglycerate-dependent phosphoglycerate mutase
MDTRGTRHDGSAPADAGGSIAETDLLLVRHGEAWCNLAGVAGGDRGCTGLTDRGHDQAGRLAARLAALDGDRAVDALYVAPRRRARETAAPIAAALDLPPRVETRLSGPAHGVADGRPWTEIWRAFGGSPADRPDEPFAEGAESWHQFLDRAMSCLRSLLDRHAGDRIIVVAHAETVEAAHLLLLGLPRDAHRQVSFAVAHASLTHWTRRTPPTGRTRWTLTAHNDVGHLSTAPTPAGLRGTDTSR